MLGWGQFVTVADQLPDPRLRHLPAGPLGQPDDPQARRRAGRPERSRAADRNPRRTEAAKMRERWEASVARCLPNRWNPLLLPGGVRPRFCPCNFSPLGRQLRSNCERLVIVGTCGDERFYGSFRPAGNQVFIALVDPISPPSAPAETSRCPPLLVVEAPGYCPPGPKCLFHLTIYRHSRVAPAPLNRRFAADSQGCAVSAPRSGTVTNRHWRLDRGCCYARPLVPAEPKGNFE